ncbi:hypothetical protein DMUE_2621 [Dictyocoela muelleri]|nr:hypothetical protein DMUE_2621 [Dictyocoela muelleri]
MALLNLKYNATKAHHYYQKLSNTRQRNFLKIKTYATKISEVCQKLGICNGWSESLINEKIEETFFVNLENCVKMEMTKLGRLNLSDIYSTIENIESMIIEEMYSKETRSKSVVFTKKQSNNLEGTGGLEKRTNEVL